MVMGGITSSTTVARASYAAESQSAMGMKKQSLPSGKHTNSYGKWTIEIDGLPIKNGDFL